MSMPHLAWRPHAIHMHFLHRTQVGEHVTIKGDPAIQKSLPHKVYHGKTGVVWNITPRALGVIVNKRHRQRIIPKRVNVCVLFCH